MKPFKIILLVLIIMGNLLLTGCWNYREIEKLAIVAGVAIDKGTNSRYRVTVEIVHISQGRDAKPSSRIVTMEGETMMDAVRNEISLSGERLYWSHAKVILLSQEVAREGIAKIIDWYTRDSETRTDVKILISGEKTAGEILERGKGVTEEIKSFELNSMLDNQKSLAKAPKIDLFDFLNMLESDGTSPVMPLINIRQADSKSVLEIMGTAVFRHDKLIGFLDGEETKYLLFIKNKVKAGVLSQEEPGEEGTCPVALEIFGNKTRLEPLVSDNNIEFKVNITVTTAIDEIEGSENFIEDKGRIKLEKDSEASLKAGIENLIKKVQTDFGVDIFGFGSELKNDKPKLWGKLSNNWDDRLKSLKVTVIPKIHIRNSAVLSKTIKVKD
ncbi:MAG: Ger(x)C family spore germination protein [Bacillota bacterium]|nr:Ger(x)C family spore germination protein [Bacillota bacterium]